MDPTSTSTNTPAPAAQSAVPSVDTQKLAESAANAATAAATKLIEEKSTELATKKLQEIGRHFMGEKQVDPAESVVREFAKDPIRVLRTAADVAKHELRQELNQEKTLANEQREVGSRYVNEYPQITEGNKVALVEKLTERYQNEGISHKEALDRAFKETVKEFGLKSVSELQQEGQSSGMGLPRGGGVGQSAPKYDLNKSATDFISGMKSRVSSIRQKKS